AVKMTWLLAMRDWRRRHRFTTMSDLRPLVISAIAGAGLLYLCNVAANLGVPRSVVLLDALLSIVAVGGLRAAARVWGDNLPFSTGVKQRTLIYGANSDALSLLRSLQVSGSEYLVVGFVDPDHESPNTLIAGKPVFNRRQLVDAARKLNAQHLL